MRTDRQLAQRLVTLARDIADLVERLSAIGTAVTPAQRRSQTMMLRTLRRRQAELAAVEAGDRRSASKHAAEARPSK